MAHKKSPSLAGFYRSHHKLIWALCVGVAAYAALLAVQLEWTARALIAWNALALSFILILFNAARRLTPQTLAQHAAEQDEGRLLVLGVSIVSSAASLVAIWHELIAVRSAGADVRAAHTVLAFTTIALSWLFMHAVFATHYAHEFYSPDDVDEPDDARQSLGFPGHKEPDFWDFLHFSLTIGVALQTADIAIQSRDMRRIVTIHSLASFVFNTVILAVSVNFAASLFAPA